MEGVRRRSEKEKGGTRFSVREGKRKRGAKGRKVRVAMVKRKKRRGENGRKGCHE